MKHVATVCAALALLALPAAAQEKVHVTEAQASKLFAGKAFSPYVNRTFPSRVFWGDTHLHTGLSLDAGLFGNTLTLDDAYRFARGEQIKASSGLPAKLSRPLDWLVITDHTDLMGFATDLKAGAPHNRHAVVLVALSAVGAVTGNLKGKRSSSIGRGPDVPRAPALLNTVKN